MNNGRIKIKAANAVYTGGGIYIVYGQLEDGRYFEGSDDFPSIIIDCDLSGQDWDDCFTSSWYDKHMLGSCPAVVWDMAIDWVLENNPAGGNYNSDLAGHKNNKHISIEDIHTVVDDATSMILVNFQDQLDIRSGDADIWQVINLEAAQFELTKAIADILAGQLGSKEDYHGR